MRNYILWFISSLPPFNYLFVLISQNQDRKCFFVFFIYALLIIRYFIYISDFSFFLSEKKSQSFPIPISFFHALEWPYSLWIPCISPFIYLLQWLANSFCILQIIYKYLAASVFPIEKFLHFFLNTLSRLFFWNYITDLLIICIWIFVIIVLVKPPSNSWRADLLCE